MTERQASSRQLYVLCRAGRLALTDNGTPITQEEADQAIQRSLQEQGAYRKPDPHRHEIAERFNAIHQAAEEAVERGAIGGC